MRTKLKLFIVLIFISITNCYATQSYLLVAGNSNPELAQAVAKELKINLSKATIDRFNDGELNIQLHENVRNKHVYIIQSTAKSSNASINDNLIELYLMARTLKRASAKEITAIIPYYGYARQDRKTSPRVPISASDVAMLIEGSGIDRVVTVDLHAGQIQGFFHTIPVDNLYASVITVDYFKKKRLDNIVIVSPDAGGVERAKKFKQALENAGVQSEFAIIIKQRAKAGEIKEANLIGDVKGKNAIIIDDICDTGGTLAKAAEELKKFGANKVYANITHPVFSKNAIDVLDKSAFEEVLVTDTISYHGTSSKIKQISVAPLLAKVITRINNGDSVSTLFN
jgi:ribose-phosphate pyrophosphokinase